jgi:DNA mismatch repair protein MutS
MLAETDARAGDGQRPWRRAVQRAGKQLETLGELKRDKAAWTITPRELKRAEAEAMQPDDASSPAEMPVKPLAECAARYNYVRPELNEGREIIIAAGRHPMIEQRLDDRRQFVPNDTHLANDDTQIVLLTAPNMAGKSVYLRQVALISLLAQIDSFVPAASARLGILDRSFTRVGLTDYTLRGHSSFRTWNLAR